MHTSLSNRPLRGFTIVEMLVVIAVIALLATITILSYSSIQERAHTENAKNSASLLKRKVQAYYQINNSYPTPSTATTQLNTQKSTSLDNLVKLGVPTTTNGERTVALQLCTSGGSGYRITYWDYEKNLLPATAQIIGGANVSGCSLWTTAS